MKRIMYVSTLVKSLTEEEISDIGRISSKHNRTIGVTGILLSAHEFFFQILEGAEVEVDRLLEQIRRDPRHRDLTVLKAEMSVTVRLFPNWSMRTIRLGETNGMILQAVRIMLENITQSHRIIERYTQPSVLQFLTQGLNPLEIPVKKTRKIILFGDMVAFSTMSQKFPVEEVTTVVNAYLEVCCRRIVQHGGEVTKYIGDCVMAHFPPDYADAAIKACLADPMRRWTAASALAE
jgi:adenylate cyclase